MITKAQATSLLWPSEEKKSRLSTNSSTSAVSSGYTWHWQRDIKPPQDSDKILHRSEATAILTQGSLNKDKASNIQHSVHTSSSLRHWDLGHQKIATSTSGTIAESMSSRHLEDFLCDTFPGIQQYNPPKSWEPVICWTTHSHMPPTLVRSCMPNKMLSAQPHTAKDHKASAFSHGANHSTQISSSSTSQNLGTILCQTRKHGRKQTTIQQMPNFPGKGVCAKEKAEKPSKQKGTQSFAKGFSKWRRR